MHAPPNHRRELEAAAIAAAQQAEIARDEANHALKAKDALAKGRKNRHSTSGGDLFVKGGANATPQQVAWNKLRSNVHGAFPYLENALTGNENFVPLPPTAHPPPNPQLPSTTRHASSNPAVVVMPHHAHSDRGVVHRSSLPPPTIPPSMKRPPPTPSTRTASTQVARTPGRAVGPWRTGGLSLRSLRRR